MTELILLCCDQLHKMQSHNFQTIGGDFSIGGLTLGGVAKVFCLPPGICVHFDVIVNAKQKHPGCKKCEANQK